MTSTTSLRVGEYVNKPEKMYYIHFSTYIWNTYTIMLMDIFPYEKELNDGRFRNFSYHEQQNKVVLSIKAVDGSILRITFGNIISWISENNSKTWSVKPKMLHVGLFEFVFSFSDIGDSVHFALHWK